MRDGWPTERLRLGFSDILIAMLRGRPLAALLPVLWLPFVFVLEFGFESELRFEFTAVGVCGEVLDEYDHGGVVLGIVMFLAWLTE